MSKVDFIHSLDLPVGAIVNQRVPKKMLIENLGSGTTDRRVISDHILEILWVAALKPNTVGVLAYQDEVREYLEIAVIMVVLRDVNDHASKVARLQELIHRAIAYPTILVIDLDDRSLVSLAHKRWAQNEIGKVIIDGEIEEVAIEIASELEPTEAEFVRSLKLRFQPQGNLFELYQGWMDALISLQAARITGCFTTSKSANEAQDRRQALIDYLETSQELAQLLTKVKRERQMAKIVDLNLAIKALRIKIEHLSNKL
jgi:hypothetical protein